MFSNLRSFIFSFFVLLILSLKISQGQASCQELLSNVITKISSQISVINQRTFQERRQTLSDQISRGEKISVSDLQSPIEKIAFFDLIEERNGVSFLQLADHIKNGDLKLHKKLISLFDKVSFKKSISSQILENTLSRLYLLLHPFSKKLTFSLTKMKQAYIQELINVTLLSQIINEEVENLSNIIIKHKSFHLKNETNFFSYSNKKNLTLSIIYNGLFLAYFGVPVHIPNLEFMKQGLISSELREKIKRYGPESVQEELSELYSSRAHLQLGWNSFKKIYNAVFLSIAIFISAQTLPMLKLTLANLFVSSKRLLELQDKTFDPQTIRDQQFTSWKEAFFELEGRYPNPKIYPEDSIEWDRVYKSLQKIPDYRLKVDFSSR